MVITSLILNLMRSNLPFDEASSVFDVDDDDDDDDNLDANLALPPWLLLLLLLDLTFVERAGGVEEVVTWITVDVFFLELPDDLGVDIVFLLGVFSVAFGFDTLV